MIFENAMACRENEVKFASMNLVKTMDVDKWSMILVLMIINLPWHRIALDHS